MVLAINELTFKEEVLESATPVLVNFWAPWCGVCQLVEPFLADIQAGLEGQVKVVSVNADRSLKLASTYKLTTLPTVLLFSDGNLLHRFDCFRNREELRALVTDMRSRLEALSPHYSHSR